MAPGSRYPVPAHSHRLEEEVRRSRFITTVAPAPSVEQAAAVVAGISDEFRDATHHCWAYVVGPPGSTERIGMSDAGEPHGTAGRPMLNVLLRSGVGDVIAVVTRYFGGTKLGTGGLVRAYSGCVQHALATLPLGERVDLVALGVAVDYRSVAPLQQLFAVFEVRVVSQRFEADAWFDLRLPEVNLPRFRQALLDATRGQARFEER